MSTEQSNTAAAIESAVRQLVMVNACSDLWTDADQVRFVRTAIEEGINELARAEQAQFEIIAECVMLAGENMQDARLSFLEQSSEQEAGGIFDFLVNLGIMLALELLLVSGLVYAVPALVALVSGMVQAKKARQLVSAIAHQRASESQHRSSLQAVSAAGKKVVKKLDQVEGLWSRRAEGGEIYFLYKRAVREWKNLENEYAIGLAALERDVDLAKRAFDAVKSISVDPLPHLSSEKLRTFMSGALAHTVVSRVSENSAASSTEKIIKTVSGSGATVPPPLFQTSTLLSRFLAQNRHARNQADEEWSRTRFHIRFLSDDDLINSEIAQELFFRIHYEQSPATIQELSFTDQEFLTLGIEGALWVSWLCHIKALGQEKVSGRLVRSGARQGEIHGDLFVTDFPEGTSGLANGVSYPGLIRISDKHAEYLYGRFAKAYYIANPKRAPNFATPISTDPGAVSGTVSFNRQRYDEVASMAPTSLGMLDRDRLIRVAEMKLLVILYFQLLATAPDTVAEKTDVGTEARKVLRKLLELPADNIINNYQDSLPPISELGAPAISQADQEGLNELADALAATGRMDEKWLVGDARSQLEAAVGNLDMKITTYPLLFPPSAAAFSADRAVADGALRAIEQEQQEVTTRHAKFLELAAEQPDVVAEVTAQFGDHIRALTSWLPSQSTEGTWKYYPPVETVPPVS